MTFRYNKAIIFAVILIVVLCTLLLLSSSTYAYFQTDNSFDNVNVLDDLQSSTLNGAPFDIRDYPYSSLKELKLITAVEYCYSSNVNMRGNYALYIYVYNPRALKINAESKQNKISMAVSFTVDADGNRVADRYEKFNLQYCNKSTDDYDGLFYKFKVVDKVIEGKTMAERVNLNERVYDISGIELSIGSATNAVEYGVGGQYCFSGFAQGYGPDSSAESTLKCTVKNVESITLEVHSTHYRTDVSSLGKGHYNEVNTVYFSVPDRFFNDYGYLQKIRAEWWEYKTKIALILDNKDFVDMALQYTGASVAEYKPYGDYLMRPHNGDVPFTAYALKEMGGDYIDYRWTYNIDLYPWKAGGVGKPWQKTSLKTSTILPMVFYSPATDLDSVFSFLYSQSLAGNVKSSIVADYIYNYSNNLGNGYIDCNERLISKDLFEDSVDENRTMGYNDKTVDMNDTFDLNSYDSNHSWWDKLLDYGFSIPKTDGDYSNIAPIYEIKDADLLGGDDSIAKQLLVNKDDVAKLRKYYVDEKAKGNHVILFRFAQTDYYAENANAYKTADSMSANGYCAQMTVFLDFDVIELTFNKDGDYRVIPAVSNPIDIINGFTSPPKEFDWVKFAVFIALLIIALILLAPLLPHVLKFIAWLLCLPFKGIAKLCKSSSAKHTANKQTSHSKPHIKRRKSKNKRKKRGEQKT